MAGRRQSYYDSFPRTVFRDLDTDAYADCERALKLASTRNFIVDFGGASEAGGQAWCALDVTARDLDVRAFLSKRRDLRLRTRWINVFNPYDQAELVNAITDFYGFSPRLSKVITTPPASWPLPAPPSPRPSVRRRDRFLGRTGPGGPGERDGDPDPEAAAATATAPALSALAPPPSSAPPPSPAPSLYLALPAYAPTIGSPPVPTVVEPTAPGIEQALEMSALPNPMADRATVGSGGIKMNYMNLVQKVWHFHAVEWGGRFICLGFNHHHKTSPQSWDNPPRPPPQPADVDEPFDAGDYNPEGKRVWSWLILCDDGTVISIHEPLGNATNPEDILTIRRNMLNVFRALSLSPGAKASAARESDASLGSGMDDLPFRRLQAQNENVHGGPSLLFYYLFDDWHSIYSFVLGRGAPYSTQMRHLRNEMHKDPQLSHLSKLHRLSRQLAMLKRMYETRKVIVDNILTRQENGPRHRRRSRRQRHATATATTTTTTTTATATPTATATTTPTASPTGSPAATPLQHPEHFPADPAAATKSHPADAADPAVTYAATMGDSTVLGVPLDPLSVAKFERMRDRIRHYVLGELEALLAEKTELETLTFNLISLKQSTTVELLTRVTIWFAGFTFVFLPLTLVTGYFSMQLSDIDGKYTERTFWGSGGVAVAITLMVLYTVGKSTDTMEFGALWRGVRKVWFSWLQHHRRKGAAA